VGRLLAGRLAGWQAGRLAGRQLLPSSAIQRRRHATAIATALRLPERELFARKSLFGTSAEAD
jgi:hypothetical protein